MTNYDPQHLLDSARLIDVSEVYPRHPALRDTFWGPNLEALSDLAQGAVAREWVALVQALEQIVDLAPDRLDHSRPVIHAHDAAAALLWRLAETAAHLGYAAATHDGPAIFYDTEAVCGTCAGSGRLWAGEQQRPAGASAQEASPCGTCAGSGVVEVVSAATFHPHQALPLPAWVPAPEGMPWPAWVDALGEAQRARLGTSPTV